MGWVDGRLTFHYPDPGRHLAGIRLEQHAGLPADRLEFDYRDQAWVLDLPAPAAWRLEYQLRLRHPDGREETVNDPANPARVPGAFGDKSVLHCRDYVEPVWLRPPAARGHLAGVDRCRTGGRRRGLDRIWSPPSADNRVLVAHDGPEYDELAALGQYARRWSAPGACRRSTSCCSRPATATTGTPPTPPTPGRWPPTSCPGCRPSSARAGPVGRDGREPRRAGDAARAAAAPGAFAGLFLQSGSFFRPRLRPAESGFPRLPADRPVRRAGGPPPRVRRRPGADRR